jgi:hypothetical protein
MGRANAAGLINPPVSSLDECREVQHKNTTEKWRCKRVLYIIVVAFIVLNIADYLITEVTTK